MAVSRMVRVRLECVRYGRDLAPPKWEFLLDILVDQDNRPLSETGFVPNIYFGGHAPVDNGGFSPVILDANKMSVIGYESNEEGEFKEFDWEINLLHWPVITKGARGIFLPDEDGNESEYMIVDIHEFFKTASE